MPERTELLYGFVCRKMSKSPLHSLLMLRLLQNVLPSSRHVRPEQPLRCGDSEPEPDLSVIVGSEDDFGHDHPRTAELVIEICVTTQEYDHSKLRAYASAGLNPSIMGMGPVPASQLCLHKAGWKAQDLNPSGVVGNAAAATQISLGS